MKRERVIHLENQFDFPSPRMTNTYSSAIIRVISFDSVADDMLLKEPN